MAIFISGMRCSLSGKKIHAVNDAVVFPAFVSNDVDPIHAFSDAVMSVEAFNAHPLAAKAQSRYEEFKRQTRPQARACQACGQHIADPEDYLALGHLVDSPAHSLHRYNYAHFHRSCLGSWAGLPPLVHELESLNGSDAWGGDGLRRVIDDLSQSRG